MPRFDPFTGIRYDLTRVDIADVTAPPYDVIDAAQRGELAARHAANIVHIDLPDGEDAYAVAARTLETWLADGTLRRDEPSFYVYRMTHEDATGRTRRTTGVLGALSLSRPDEGQILPHEFTTPKARTDRLDLMRATDCNLSAVWVLSPAQGLTALLHCPEPPETSWTADDGVRHEFWLVTDRERIAAISDAIGSAPVVVADGHHRYETALTYRDEQRAAGNTSGPFDAMLSFVVELLDEELTVLPIHRLLDGVENADALVESLRAWFTVTPAGPIDEGTADVLREQQCLALVLPDRACFLVPLPGTFDGMPPLDTVWLDAALAKAPPHELRYQHGIEQVRQAVMSGKADAGVLVRPVTVAHILDIAHGGERMPPKTTFFTPKPVTGLVLRDARHP